MKNTIITISGRTYKASECVAQLATARAKVAKGIAVNIYQQDINKFSAALADAGISEDATFEAEDNRSMLVKRMEAEKAERKQRNMVGEASGDINNLLRVNGCSAACDD